MSLDQELEREFAPAWRRKAGETLVGEIVHISERAGEFSSCPIVTIRRDDGEELAFHAFHIVAQSELARWAPRAGERIGVSYLGQVAPASGGNRYRAYKVRLDRPRPAAFDWGRYGGGGSAPVESEIPAASSEVVRKLVEL